MADQLDNRPVFTIVMGCNGAGKSAWKRENWDRLPNPYFDQDSIAGGVGDWNSEESRKRTRRIVDAEITQAIRDRKDFGLESTYSGLPGPQIVQRAREEGYRAEGVYIGTESPGINADRVRHRVDANTGHWVDVARLPQQHGFSLSNLSKTAEQFDELEIVDNSTHADDRRPMPISQIQMAEGEVKWGAEKLMLWCENWLSRFERSQSARTAGSGIGGGGTPPPPCGQPPPTGGGKAPQRLRETTQRSSGRDIGAGAPQLLPPSVGIVPEDTEAPHGGAGDHPGGVSPPAPESSRDHDVRGPDRRPLSGR